MTEKRRRKRRKVTIRSYRKARQLLLVFGTAGMALGAGLVAVFILKNNMLLVRVGIIYMLVAGLLLGIRGVLAHLDELNKHRRAALRSGQEQTP